RCHQRSMAMLDISFPPFCAFLGSLGLLCVALVGAWCQHWRGGFSLDGGSQTFNWHPMLMVTGLVVLYGAGEHRECWESLHSPFLTFFPLTAALVYRVPNTWNGPKLPWKLLHGGLALGAFVLTVLGLAAVFRFHNSNGTPNMYSLHSWMGLGTILLFSCQVGASSDPINSPQHPELSCPHCVFPQWAAGFGAFLLPWAPAWLRQLYKPIHVFFGSTILMLSVASCVSGINEKLFFSLKNGTTQYKLLPAEAVFANTLGILILLFGVLVVAALARPSWKRPDSNSLDSRQVPGTHR
ncbi:CYAC3 protein, partial [Tyrannus savana]|nr:CYAC3 protein [Tyrannus savana]